MSLALEERAVKALETIAAACKKNTETLAAMKKLLDEMATSVAQITAVMDKTSEG